MTTIQIQSTDLQNAFQQLQQTLGGHIDSGLKETILNIDSTFGYGCIRGMRLKGGISFLQFEMTFNEDVTITFSNPEKTRINFAYCSEGSMAHSFGNAIDKTEISPFQTAILANISQDKNQLYFGRDTKTSANIISVKTNFGESYRSKINTKLKELFLNQRENDLTYLSSPNLKIAQRMSQLRAIKQEGVVRTLLIEGLVHMILALEIDQHKTDLNNAQKNTGSLTRKELADIKELSDFINNFPETSLTVTELAHKIGLTPSKLQEGFKLMHNRTVNDYIRDVRVTKSEELIKTTDLNISQILYTLGFSSRSYFSKIFKKKYNCSPSKYKAKNKLAVSV